MPLILCVDSLYVTPLGSPVTFADVTALAYSQLTTMSVIAFDGHTVWLLFVMLTLGSGLTTILAVAVPLGVHDGDWLLVAVTVIL